MARAAHARNAAVSSAAASASRAAIRAAAGTSARAIQAQPPAKPAGTHRADPRPVRAGLTHGDVRAAAGRVRADDEHQQAVGVEQVRPGAVAEHHVELDLHKYVGRRRLACGEPVDERVGLGAGQAGPAHGAVAAPHPPAAGGIAATERRRGACHQLRRHPTVLAHPTGTATHAARHPR